MATSGKNKRRQLEAFDEIHNVVLSVDSSEEVDTLEWLTECYKAGIINSFSYQPDSFVLFEQEKYRDVNNREKTLFQDHKYTADWVLEFTPSAYMNLAKEFRIPYDSLSCDNVKVYLDSKGTFNRNERSFGYNQKWMWQKFKIYVYKLIPKKFFAKMGVPEKCKLTPKTKKPRTMFKGFKSVVDVFSLQKKA